MFDVAVAGLGAMGSATAFHLARRGARVIGFDRHAPPHTMGSSHGRSRIIREAYFEDPLYVPLVQRAYEGWAELEALTGKKLLTPTGGLMIGPPESDVVRGARASAERHGLPFEQLTGAELRNRASAFHAPADHIAIWEPNAGVLAPEAAVGAHLDQARKHGAVLHDDEPVLRWRPIRGGVAVETAAGTYEAERLVISAGAWATELLADLALPLTIERNVQFWFDPVDPAEMQPDRFPIFIHEYAPGLVWYGFPDIGDGAKLALHHQGEKSAIDAVRRTVEPNEVDAVRPLVERLIPAANGRLLDSAVCLYTNTPDNHFILDTHPAHPAVFVASPCSGHGFKFSSAIGELIADLMLTGQSRFDLTPFRISRFGQR